MAYSDGIYEHFQNACNGIVRRCKKGDYDYLAKLGAGCLIGFGCYKLYQRYDPHFFITDHVPHYLTNSMIPTITLSIMLRELSGSANASDGQSYKSDKGQLPSRDSDVTFEEMNQLNELGNNPPLKVNFERDPQTPLYETSPRAFVQPSSDPPVTSRPRETYDNSNVGTAGPSSHNQHQQSQQHYQPQAAYQQQPQVAPAPHYQQPPAAHYQQPAPHYQQPAPHYQQPAAPHYQQPAAPHYQQPPPQRQPMQQQSDRPTIHTGITANRVKNLIIKREGCTTTVKGHQGSNIKLDDEFEDVGDAHISEKDCKKTFE